MISENWPSFFEVGRTPTLVNRVDKLTFASRNICYPLLTHNKLMNSFVLRMKIGSGKLTLQVFKNSIMCLSNNFCNFSYAFYILSKKFGIQVKTYSLCTSVWTYQLLGRIMHMADFYSQCLSAKPRLLYVFEPELFPCITISKFSNCSVVLRVFKTGKVIILGVKHVKEIVSPLAILESMFFDYSMSEGFANF